MLALVALVVAAGLMLRWRRGYLAPVSVPARKAVRQLPRYTQRILSYRLLGA
jgi:hypothetical protein